MRKMLLALALLAVAGIAQAYTPPTDLVGQALQASSAAITNNLLVIAVKLLFTFLVLQFTIDGLAMLGNDATIEKVIGKIAMSVLWAAFCLYLLEPGTSGGTRIGDFMQGTVDYFLEQAGAWVGTSGGSFDTWDILSIGLASYGKITLAISYATITNAGTAAALALVPGLGFVTALMVFFTSMVILVCCAYIALKVFLVKVQAALFIAVAPLSVAMLGLKGLRDQGIAPFKMLLGLIYRIVILAAIVTSLQIVAEAFTNFIDEKSYGLMADIWTPILGSMFGFVLLAYLTHHADGIAASLASGNVALGSGDLAGSVAAGVAAGMAAGAAGAALNQATTGVTRQSMADWMKKNSILGLTPDKSKSDSGLIKPDSTVPAAQKAPAPQAAAPRGADGLDAKADAPKSKGENQKAGAAGKAGGAGGENSIGGLSKVDDVKRRLEKHADNLNREVRHDEGQDMGIHIDGYHRE